MTGDYAEDFVEACAKEREPYLIVYRGGDGSVNVRWDVENWDAASAELTPEQDLISAVEAAMSRG